MKPVRIEYVIDHLNVGGAQRHLVQLFSGIDRKRFAPQVCVGKGGGALVPVIERLGVPVRDFGVGRSLAEPAIVPALIRFARRLRAERVDVVHGYLYLGNILGVLGGRLAGTPVRIAAKRSLDRYTRRAQLGATRLANRLAHRIVCNADAVRRFVLEVERPTPSKIDVIPNGIQLRFEPVTPMRPHGVPANATIIGTIGRLSWKKAYDDLLAAAARVVAKRDDAHFVIVGDGPLRAELEAQIESLGIRSHVHLTGELEDVRGALAGFDLFTLCSIIEGMPNVLLEALAAEKPAVVTAVGGMPEIVTHAESGLIVPPASPDSLAEALLRLLERPEERARLAKAGRSVVERKFSADVMVASYEQFYDRVLSERGLARSRPLGRVNAERASGIAAGH